MLLNLWRDCSTNIGDKVCSPLDYFPLPAERRDFWGISPADLIGKTIILGGGGLSIFRESLDTLEPFAEQVIVWGIGVNEPIVRPTAPRLPSLLQRCKLVGVRDWGQGYDWAPCPSAMSPLFDLPYEVRHEVGFYEHWEIPLQQAGQPLLRNNCQTMAEAISFLGSCQTVVTNTYHGAYWATLLGKRVLAWPINTKLFYFKHQPRIILNNNWQQNLKFAQVYPEALAECRAASQSFFERVLEVCA